MIYFPFIISHTKNIHFIWIYHWNSKIFKSVYKQKLAEIRYSCTFLLSLKPNTDKLVKARNLIFGDSSYHIKLQLSHRVQYWFCKKQMNNQSALMLHWTPNSPDLNLMGYSGSTRFLWRILIMKFTIIKEPAINILVPDHKGNI